MMTYPAPLQSRIVLGFHSHGYVPECARLTHSVIAIITLFICAYVQCIPIKDTINMRLESDLTWHRLFLYIRLYVCVWRVGCVLWMVTVPYDMFHRFRTLGYSSELQKTLRQCPKRHFLCGSVDDTNATSSKPSWLVNAGDGLFPPFVHRYLLTRMYLILFKMTIRFDTIDAWTGPVNGVF